MEIPLRRLAPGVSAANRIFFAIADNWKSAQQLAKKEGHKDISALIGAEESSQRESGELRDLIPEPSKPAGEERKKDGKWTGFAA